MTVDSALAPVRTLETRYYTDPQIFDLEKKKLFTSTWQFAGHASQISARGDFFRFDLAGENLFCVRGHDGTVRTFYNVCQHRAHEVVTTNTGTVDVFICPYHSWSYELDGQLNNAPNIGVLRGVRKADIRLSKVRTQLFLGFIFVNLDPDSPDMDQLYPGLREGLTDHVPHIEDLQPLEYVEIDEACNWKVSVENYNECYHCVANHPTFVNGVVNAKSYNVHQDHHTLQHTTESQNLERMSYPIDASANEFATRYKSWFLWPMFSFQVYPGNVLNTYHWRPIAVDRVVMYRGWYTVGGAESDVIRGLATQDRATTVEEDIHLVESVQRGLGSRGYTAGPLVLDPNEGLRSEHPIAALHTWYRAAIDA